MIFLIKCTHSTQCLEDESKDDVSILSKASTNWGKTLK